MRAHVRIQGRVQGVGYRYATQHEADRQGVKGWVRNRADGSVEAEFVGERATLESMIAWCEQGPALARVTNVEVDWLDDAADYPSFTVRA